MTEEHIGKLYSLVSKATTDIASVVAHLEHIKEIGDETKKKLECVHKTVIILGERHKQEVEKTVKNEDRIKKLEHKTKSQETVINNSIAFTTGVASVISIIWIVFQKVFL